MRIAVLLSVLCCGALAAAATIKQPTFFGRRDYGFLTPFVTVAEVNGDKIPDMITVGGNTIQTWFGNGLGAFATGPRLLTQWMFIVNAVPVDLNGDGETDLVIAGQAQLPAYGIGVCFGNGDGTFQQPVLYPIGGTGYTTTGVALGDFNGDGILDAVIGGETGIWLFTGKGGGVFNTGVLLTPSISGLRDNIVTADFNGDGYLDLAAATDSGFVVLFGNGNGTFQAPVSYTAASLPVWIATSDLNRDGHLDIAIAAPEANSVYIYLNNGKGRFSAPSVVPLICNQIAIGDVNGDGIPDLVSSLGYVSFGLGKAKFAPAVYYPVETSEPSQNVVLADLRKKGLTDILFGENFAVSVLLNSGKGTFEDGVWTAVPGAGNCGAAADFNGDGKPDLAVPTSTGITILLGTGNASAPYTIGPSIAISGGATCPITGDLNGDGIPDLVVGANGLGGVGAYLGNGDGTFTLAGVIPMSPGFLVLADFKHDGILDVADSSNQFALGNGDGTFQAVLPILASPPPDGFTWIAAGDVNNDGWTDILAVQSEYAYSNLYVILNNQKGGFRPATTIPVTGGAESVMAADLNGDGNLDAVVQTQDNAQVYLGNGQGGFTLSTALGYPGSDTLPAEIGDVNGDGIPDILLPSDGSVGITLGKGDGTFPTYFTVGVGPAEGQILLQNLHGQTKPGLPDLVEPDGSGGVTVLINLTKLK
jgi:hypothetical protein